MKNIGYHTEVMAYRQLAYKFHSYGFNVLPTGKNGDAKKPLLPPNTGWGDKPNPEKGINNILHLGSNRQSLEALQFFDFSEALGLAGVTGSNSIRVIDFDPVEGRPIDLEVIERALEILGLAPDYEWLVKSGKGWHIWIQVSELPFGGKKVSKYAAKDANQFQHLELRFAGCYTILPYSKHESGNVYRFANLEQGFPESAPTDILVDKVEKMVEHLCEIRQSGPKQDSPSQANSETQKSSYDYAGKALVTAIRMIEEAQNGFKWEALNKAAYLLGGYIGTGLLDFNSAYDALGKAIEEKPNVKDLVHAKNTIKIGLMDGSKNSFTLDQLEKEREYFLATLKPRESSQLYSQVIELSPILLGVDIWLLEIKQKIREGKVIDRRLAFKGLYRDGIVNLFAANGYCKRYEEDQSYIFIQERNNIIEEIEPSLMKDYVVQYIDTITEPLTISHEDLELLVLPTMLKETFLRQSHLVFNEKFLEHLPNHDQLILRDDSESCFIPYQNQIVSITSTGIGTLEYSELGETCVWKKQIIDREYQFVEDYTQAHFATFISNVCGGDIQKEKAFHTGIGYLIHNYNHPSRGQAVICYDEQITDLRKPQGGTGKGLFAKAIREIRNTVKIDGKKFNEGDRFCFQDVSRSTQVAWFDDVKPDLGFDRFNSILTDGWNVEHKFKSSFFLPAEESPKMIICSNSILDCEGSTRKRRQFILEFGNYYSKFIKIGTEEPIIEEHGCTFFSADWDAEEWSRFDAFMVVCVAQYMKEGLIPYQVRNVTENRIRQVLGEEFYEWVLEKRFSPDTTHETKPLYHEYWKIYHEGDEKFSQRRFTNMLKRYGEIMGWKLKCQASHGTSTFQFSLGN